MGDGGTGQMWSKCCQQILSRELIGSRIKYMLESHPVFEQELTALEVDFPAAGKIRPAKLMHGEVLAWPDGTPSQAD
jgi:hypothetical protein